MPATYVPGISRQTTVWYQVRTYNIGLHPNVRSFFLFERSEFLIIATFQKKNLRVFDYVAAAVLAADADAAVLVETMTPPYVRQKRLLAG